MFKSPQAYIDEFTARQGCPWIWSDDGLHMIFENGARIVVKNNRGETVVDGEVEPANFRDEEDALRRQLSYWKIKHSREVAAWSSFHESLKQAAANAATHNILNWLPPSEADLDQVDAGKKRCDALAAKVAEISEQILNLPRLVERRRQREKTKADIEQAKAKAATILQRLALVTVADPKTLHHAELDG